MFIPLTTQMKNRDNRRQESDCFSRDTTKTRRELMLLFSGKSDDILFRVVKNIKNYML